MLQRALCLSLLLPILGICSATEIPVMSGVFMPNNITVNFEQAESACSMHYSRLATLDEITAAFKRGYEYCKWGWIAEHRLVMLRVTPFLPCAGYNVGILIRDCPNIRSAFCADQGGSVSTVDIIDVPSYENATLACLSAGSVIATKKQVEGKAGNFPSDTMAWYDWGVGRVQSGVLEPDVCYDTLSQGSVFCYNPSLADVIINNDPRLWKKIAIGCLLAMVFVVLLFAAAFMKGNKFICCMAERRTQPVEAAPAPMPSWNHTGAYRRISQANKGALYNNFANLEKRPSAIRPDMNNYRTHYTNMAFDNTGEQ